MLFDCFGKKNYDIIIFILILWLGTKLGRLIIIPTSSFRRAWPHRTWPESDASRENSRPLKTELIKPRPTWISFEHVTGPSWLDPQPWSKCSSPPPKNHHPVPCHKTTRCSKQQWKNCVNCCHMWFLVLLYTEIPQV